MIYVVVLISILILITSLRTIFRTRKVKKIKEEVFLLKQNFTNNVKNRVKNNINLKLELDNEIINLETRLQNDVNEVIYNTKLENREKSGNKDTIIEIYLSDTIVNNLALKNAVSSKTLYTNVVSLPDDDKKLLSSNLLRFNIDELFDFYIKGCVDIAEGAIWKYEYKTNEISECGNENFDQSDIGGMYAANDNELDKFNDSLTSLNMLIESKIIELLLNTHKYFSILSGLEKLKKLKSFYEYTYSEHYTVIFNNNSDEDFYKNIIYFIEGEYLNSYEPINPIGANKERLYKFYYQNVCIKDDDIDLTINNIKATLNRDIINGEIINFPSNSILELRKEYIIFKEKFLALTEQLDYFQREYERGKLKYTETNMSFADKKLL